MIIPSEGIENRTGTVSQPTRVGSRNSLQLEEFGDPDYPVSSLARASPQSVHTGSALEGSNALEPINVIILFHNVTPYHLAVIL